VFTLCRTGAAAFTHPTSFNGFSTNGKIYDVNIKTEITKGNNITEETGTIANEATHANKQSILKSEDELNKQIFRD
jgi:hypothetical protein